MARQFIFITENVLKNFLPEFQLFDFIFKRWKALQ